MTLRVVALMLVVLVASCSDGGDDGSPVDRRRGALVGVFAVTAGRCDTSGAPAGSWFRMIRPGGTLTAGPFVSNPDSTCADRSITPLRTGADGGLRTGLYQPSPGDPFDDAGHATAALIIEPVRWSGFDFGLSTNERDPQAKVAVAAPALYAEGRVLAGDLRAVALAWNNQHLNQGSPKPDGSRPGLTSGPRGAYDRATRTFTLEWSSQVVGGQYNNHTGVWHLEGTFEPAGS